MPKTVLNRCDGQSDGPCIVLRGDSDKEIYFANVHQLAKKIVREESLITQWCFRCCSPTHAACRLYSRKVPKPSSPRRTIIIVVIETKKIDKGQASAGKANPRFAGKYFRR